MKYIYGNISVAETTYLRIDNVGGDIIDPNGLSRIQKV